MRPSCPAPMAPPAKAAAAVYTGVLLSAIGFFAPAAAAGPSLSLPSAQGWRPVGEPPGPLPPSTLVDCRLTLFIRQAFLQDALLAPLNIGVSVHDHVATLWGPVPSLEVSRRAEERVRQVLGIAGVVNELRIEPPIGPQWDFRKPPGAPPQSPPLRLPPVLPPAVPPVTLTGRGGEPGPAAGQVAVGGTLGLPDALPDASGSPLIVPPIVVHAPPDAGSEEGAIMPPISVTFGTPPETNPAPGQPDLATAIDTLRQGDERYRRVRVLVNGGVVHLGGVVYAWEDLFGLAKAISRLPGVERVLLEDAETDRTGR